jgi:hypothetical protein
MAWRDFVTKLERLQQERQSDIALFLNPRPFLLPHPVQRYDDPYLPFGKAVIKATRDLVCAYVFDLGSYLGIGAAGAVALERTIAYAAQDTVTILHGPFSGVGFSAAADTTGFGVDALTLVNPVDMAFYLGNAPYAAFLVTDVDAIPVEGGIFLEAEQKLLLRSLSGTAVKIRLTNDDVLYIDGTEDFAEKIRAAVEQMR